MLGGGDDADADDQPVFVDAWAAEAGEAERFVAEDFAEETIYAIEKVIGFDAVTRQILLRFLVDACVHAFLTDEALHLLAQHRVGDHRQHLVVDAAEPQLAGRQQQVNAVDHVAGEVVAGQPVQRRAVEIELHAAGGQCCCCTSRCFTSHDGLHASQTNN